MRQSLVSLSRSVLLSVLVLSACQPPGGSKNDDQNGTADAVPRQVADVDVTEDGSALDAGVGAMPDAEVDPAEFVAVVLAHDAQGNATRYDYQVDGQSVGSELRTYNAAGDVLTTTSSDFEGVVTRRQRYEYNEAGDPTEFRTASSSNGPGEWVGIWSYDDEGRVLTYATDWIGNHDAPDTPEQLFTATEWNESGEAVR